MTFCSLSKEVIAAIAMNTHAQVKFIAYEVKVHQESAKKSKNKFEQKCSANFESSAHYMLGYERKKAEELNLGDLKFLKTIIERKIILMLLHCQVRCTRRGSDET